VPPPRPALLSSSAACILLAVNPRHLPVPAIPAPDKWVHVWLFQMPAGAVLTTPALASVAGWPSLTPRWRAAVCSIAYTNI